MNRILLCLVILSAVGSLIAQNTPTIGMPENDTLLMGSGQNFLMIPDVDDGEGDFDQEISISAISSDTTILEINDVSFTPGHTLAVIHVSEKGKTGTVTLDVEASDADGTANTSFTVYVGPYANPGINFEIHDVVFWQRFVPLESNPDFSMITNDGLAPYAEIDLAGLALSVYSDCKDSPPCTGTDFFTSMFKGYLLPPVSGKYHLYMQAGDQSSIGLSSDENFENVQVVMHSAENIGSSSGNKEWKSLELTLEAGKTYAIYGVQWIIHNPMGGMLWEGPGIAKEYIPGLYMAHVYDVIKPSAPKNLNVLSKGITDLVLSWSEAWDDRSIVGYNIYLNGIRVNETPLSDTTTRLIDLAAGTDYCLVVTSVDGAGNESAESEIISTATYENDDVAPHPPTSLEAAQISDLAVKLVWSGGSDDETEVRGYNLYKNGTLYNTSGLILKEEIKVIGLTPRSSYTFDVEAVDAAYNTSVRSDTLNLTTLAFDPNDTHIIDKKGRLNISLEVVGRSDGIGVNPDYVNGDFLDDPELLKSIRELGVAALRWGALTANPLNFKDYIGSDKAMTFGRMMEFCNEIGAYTVISCGVEDATDWRQNPQTFTNFLEYLAGPASSEYGAIRAAEGYDESLLEGSRGLVFEFGNEVWGANAHSAQIGGDYAEYGRWCREMAVLMRASEYYKEEKIFLVYSGRNPHPDDWSESLHRSLLGGDRGELDWLAVSGYMGGNLDYSPEIDPGESELDYYKNGISDMVRNIEGLGLSMHLMVETSGSIKPTYMYEANMTNSSYYGRLGQALVQTDYYASVLENGGVIPTVFHLTGGQWKMIVPSQNYKKLPLFYTTKYFNKLCKGSVLRTGFETSLAGADPVGCHAYAEEGSFGVLLISRDFENDWTVQVDLPDELKILAPETVSMYTISGDSYSAKDAQVDSTVITLSDSLLVTVPRHSMVVFGFDAEGADVEDVAPGFFSYSSADSITITAYGGEEVYDIEQDLRLSLEAHIFPEDVFSDAVIWTVESDGLELYQTLLSYGFDLRGSGTCAGNGIIKVRATAWDRPEIFKELEILISGQGVDCDVSGIESEGQSTRIFPNPARDILYVEGLPQGTENLEVNDVSGRSCIRRAFSGTSTQIDLSTLDAGMYFLKIRGRDNTLVRSFICH